MNASLESLLHSLALEILQPVCSQSRILCRPLKDSLCHANVHRRVLLAISFGGWVKLVPRFNPPLPGLCFLFFPQTFPRMLVPSKKPHMFAFSNGVSPRPFSFFTSAPCSSRNVILSAQAVTPISHIVLFRNKL